MSNYKTVFFTLGLLQIILGLSMIIPILTQIYYGETDAGFIGSGIISIIFGMLFYLSNLDHGRKINLQKVFLKRIYFSPIFILFLINHKKINDGITISVVNIKNIPQSPFNQSTKAPDDDANVVRPAVPIDAKRAY